jgi:hypothetical protein
MLTDSRRIEFDSDALVAAVASSPRAAERLGLPRLPPYVACFHPEAGEVELLFGSVQAPRPFRVTANAVGALLVSYCIRARLPVPRNAKKSVHIEANAVVITFRTLITRIMAVAAEARSTSEPLASLHGSESVKNGGPSSSD